MRVGLSRILQTMDKLGILGGGIGRRRFSKHQTTVHNPGHQRLTMARGAGSINAKADILQLVNAGQLEEARAMAKDHERQCGEKLFVNAWWRQTAWSDE